jgi:hypothetical protein
MASGLGGDVAVFATACKLAAFIYRLLRWGHRYVDEGAEAFEKRYQENRLRALTAKIKALGYQLVTADNKYSSLAMSHRAGSKALLLLMQSQQWAGETACPHQSLLGGGRDRQQLDFEYER